MALYPGNNNTRKYTTTDSDFFDVLRSSTTNPPKPNKNVSYDSKDRYDVSRIFNHGQIPYYEIKNKGKSGESQQKVTLYIGQTSKSERAGTEDGYDGLLPSDKTSTVTMYPLRTKIHRENGKKMPETKEESNARYTFKTPIDPNVSKENLRKRIQELVSGKSS